MSPRNHPVMAFVMAMAVALAPVAALADAGLHKAYYTEHVAKDYAAAKKLYERVLSNGAEGADRATATAGLARCRDNLVAADLASIMPEDAAAYIELKRPGQLFGKLAAMLGLRDKSVQEVLAKRPNAGSKVPYYLPKEVVISPALFEFLESFGGVAVAITKINPRGAPEGVMALHHGDNNLFRGLAHVD